MRGGAASFSESRDPGSPCQGEVVPMYVAMKIFTGQLLQLLYRELWRASAGEAIDLVSARPLVDAGVWQALVYFSLTAQPIKA